MGRDEIYILKHKDLDVAMVKINPFSGRIEYVLEVYMPEELPVGCAEEGSGLAQWWNMRAVPDTRKGIQQQLKLLGEETSQSLMLAAYGLSLTDHYWMQPVSKELYWKNINFFENEFSDELGNLLTDTGKIDVEGHISCFSPASSVNGEMKKKWVIRDHTRFLMKINTNNYGQQAVNEKIACRLHERLGWKNYVPYEIEMTRIDGLQVPGSLTPLFTSLDTELVSAYQLIKDYKIPNDQSEYEAIINEAVKNGMEELEETIRNMFFEGKLRHNNELVVTNLRHKEALQDALNSLQLVEQSIEDGMPEDFYSIDLTSAYASLGKIIGEEVDEDVVNEIFSKFCMGK